MHLGAVDGWDIVWIVDGGETPSGGEVVEVFIRSMLVYGQGLERYKSFDLVGCGFDDFSST